MDDRLQAVGAVQERAKAPAHFLIQQTHAGGRSSKHLGTLHVAQHAGAAAVETRAHEPPHGGVALRHVDAAHDADACTVLCDHNRRRVAFLLRDGGDYCISRPGAGAAHR